MQPEEPKTQDISVPIASTPAINPPAAGAKPGGISAGQLKDRTGSSDEHDDEDESEDEDEDDLPVLIDKSKKSSFSGELAGLDGNLGSAWEAPAGSHRRRSRSDHRRRRSGRLEIESAVAD